MLHLLALALLALAGWLWLLLARRGFWRARPVLEDEPVPALAAWPEVVAVVPARDEAAHVAEALSSLDNQDYPGILQIVLVDDYSTDGTGEIAAKLAATARRPLHVMGPPALVPGWTGKLRALDAGIGHAAQVAPAAGHLLLSDADIAHDPASLRRLVTRLELDRLDLVSTMVRLRTDSVWERLLIPPFVFFFQMLYPFAAVNDRTSATAAAAGGCLLVRRQALREAGGLEAIRDRLIDDVALARRIKHRPGGPHSIRLVHSRNNRSLRPYQDLRQIWLMVARSADEQLDHSLLLLLGTVAGMSLLYLVPVLLVLLLPVHGSFGVAASGALALILMLMAYRPTARLYGLGLPWLATLPIAALLYLGMTIDSARRYRHGRGGAWKGRTFAAGSPAGTGS